MKLPEFYACDPVAMALALEDSILLEADRKFCDVELWGELTRGQMVIDWTNKMGKEANVDIVTKIDHVRVKELMEDMLKEWGTILGRGIHEKFTETTLAEGYERLFETEKSRKIHRHICWKN